MMKTLVRRLFQDGQPRSSTALMDELQLSLDVSPAEATMIIATAVAEGVLMTVRPPGAASGSEPVDDWLQPGPRFGAVSGAQT
jgi:hypothetical protein